MSRLLRCGLVLFIIYPWCYSIVSGQSGSGLQNAQSSTNLHFGLLSHTEGVVPDSECAECHPNHVRLMHQAHTSVGRGKTRGITQGMINLAVDCRPDGKGGFTCGPRSDTKCFHCHAVSVSAQTLSLVDLAEMKRQKGKNEILGHGCLTCHRPKGNKNHHITGNLHAITIRASRHFREGCGVCHGEGLEKITSGGSPHDWLARHLERTRKTAKEAGQ